MSLQQFYNAYAAWLDAGAPDGQPFVRHTGLCINLHKFGGNRDVLKEMSSQFKEAGLDEDYPFNDNSESYYRETYLDEIYLNPKRIDWVRYHANNQ